MKPFDYLSPTTLDEALEALTQPAVYPFAGGTDLLAEMKRGLVAPECLVNLKSIPELAGIQPREDGGVAIGATCSLSAIAEQPLIRGRYPLLVEAIHRTASPQIRNVATLGGNLCQRPRCWYYRHPQFPCLRKHGEGCFAVGGQDRYHAIYEGYRCFIVHPSDPAPALVALEARVQLVSKDGIRELPLERFFVTPRNDATRETILQPGQILAKVLLPPPLSGARGSYQKVAEREATDFALASLACQIFQRDGIVEHARLVLGGVAPRPYRLGEVEASLEGQPLTETQVEDACAIAARRASPLRHNRYKVRLVQGLIRKALRSHPAESFDTWDSL